MQASSSKYNKDLYPEAEIVTYTFPARGKMGPVKMIWYDGGLTPPPARSPDNG